MKAAAERSERSESSACNGGCARREPSPRGFALHRETAASGFGGALPPPAYGVSLAEGAVAAPSSPAMPSPPRGGSSASAIMVAPHDDPKEAEADRIAERALSFAGGTGEAPPPPPAGGGGPPALHRMCAQCEEEGRLHRRADGHAHGHAAAPPSVHRVLASPGASLPPAVRQYFEPRLGVDLGGVRVHNDAGAHASAHEVNAHAYTVGSNIVFARDRFSPDTPGGKRLLAHELGHVVQGGAPVLRRKPGDDDPLTGVTIALVQEKPPVFRATFAFTKTSVSFNINLSGDPSKVRFSEGSQRISASPFFRTDDSNVPVGAVLFTLPDQSDAYIWFMADEENKGALVRASQYLQNHDPVLLTVRDATKDTSDDAKGDGTAEAPAPKFIDAEDWLAKQMMPAVRKSLADDFASVKLGTLIPYRSVAIQASEGPDISMIQVNKPEGKAIAGHVRVDRRKWVGQDADSRARYAHDTAAAIVAKLTASARKERLEDLDASLAKQTTGETFPAWAIKLKQAVDKKLAEARAAAGSKPPQDIPDRLHLIHVGELVYFQLFLEREASNAPGTMIWQVAIMSPSLDEGQAGDIDTLVKTVREQTALMRTWAVKSVEKSDEPERTNILMRPIPADIRPQNLNPNGTTVTGATNSFQMSVRIDLAFSMVQGRDTWNMIGYSQSLGLGEIEVVWKVAPFTQYNAEDLVRTPAKPAPGAPPPQKSDVYFDLANRDLDQQTKIGLAMQQIDAAAIMDSAAYPVAGRKRGVLDNLDHEFSKIPGVYLVVAETRPRPLVSEKYRQVFPPSRAMLPVRVLTSKALAAETIAETPDAIADKERAKADPSLTDRQRVQIDADIKRLKAQEGMTQLGVVHAAEEDIDRRIARFTALRSWLIADRAVHPSIAGTPTEDPLLVRLSQYDRLHDTHHFESFQELFGYYGERVFDISYLAEPFESEKGQYHALNMHLKLLTTQKTESQKLQGRITEGEKAFLGGVTKQTVATLVISDTGNAIPLLLLVGEHPESKEGAYRYKIIDLTLAASPLYKMKNQIYVGDTAATREDALHEAFVQYGRDNDYADGTVHYRYAGESNLRSVPNITTWSEYAQKVAMVLAMIGMIASVVVSGGATTPAVAAVIAAITIANAALAIVLSTQAMARRSAAGTLELDADTVLDVVNIIASVIGVGSLAKGAQLGRAAQAARGAGNMARAASLTAKIEQLGRTMLVFDTAVLGTTAVATAWKVGEDVSWVKSLHLPPTEEAEALRQVAADAVMQGAMIAFQSVMLARSHLEMYRSKLENSRYKTREELGWVDAEGRITEKAPPTLRAVAEGKPPPVGERPPVSLESDLPRVKAAAEAGEVKRLPDDPDHDLEIPFRDENNELHAFKRRREDGGWCRYSTNPYCFYTKKVVDNITQELGDLGGAPPKGGKAAPKPAAPVRGGKGVPGKSWGKIGGEAATLTETIEATITQAIADLKAQIGKKWLLPHIYGTKLHKVAADLFRGMKLPRGWTAIVDQPLRKSGMLDPKFNKMTVREFLENWAPWLLPGKWVGPNVDPAKVKYTVGVPESLLNKKVGDIEPDLILVAPDGTKIVWDLSPSQNAEHIAKTMVYAHAIDPAGGRVQIGETFYRPEQNLELDSGAQARFRGTAADAEGARVSLNDDKARALARRSFGQGEPMAPDLPTDAKLRARVLAARNKRGAKPPAPLPAGVSGSVERVTGDVVIGQYYDAKSKTWKDTKVFSIHYSESGVYIRPEAP